MDIALSFSRKGQTFRPNRHLMRDPEAFFLFRRRGREDQPPTSPVEIGIGHVQPGLPNQGHLKIDW